ncbi:Phosphotransferase enzyme family protein [Aspergillus sclerotialis]|uniref:Phosphotransferase enzyme family protein n=1 Tax=Aspergillus sclerotialis TaxID=2070753 RepID=A0A3A2ZZ17_9EURO|nr:Phosphotransferase enzyme family protein [Aspergillus sclerotialis]
MKLPYYANNIPSPLPTNAEIEAAADISLEYGGRRIVEVGDHFVVKFGKGVDLIEGENMLSVSNNTNINIPRVYALYSDPTTGKNYIIMEQKERTAMILRKFLDDLRYLPSLDYYGSLGKWCLLDEIFWTTDPEPSINGRFMSTETFIEGMALKYTYDGRPPCRADFYRQCLPRVLYDDYGPTFTHGDFQRKNIIIREDVEQSGLTGESNFRVFIIDWEKSGWYPSYWEYYLAVCALRWDDDWCLWVEKVLEPFASQAG